MAIDGPRPMSATPISSRKTIQALTATRHHLQRTRECFFRKRSSRFVKEEGRLSQGTLQRRGLSRWFSPPRQLAPAQSAAQAFHPADVLPTGFTPTPDSPHAGVTTLNPPPSPSTIIWVAGVPRADH
jgi:hypothetical protein